MKNNISKLICSTILIILFAAVVCDAYWKSNKPNNATFNGISALDNKSKSMKLDSHILCSNETDQESIKVLEESYKKLEVSPIESRPRYAAEIGICALLSNDVNLAENALDYSITNIENITTAGVREQKVTSTKGSEEQKIFKGEPHEKVMVYLYRGMLYMAKGDYENSQACFKNAALQDALAANESDRSNWLTIDLLQLVCKRLMKDSDEKDFETYIRQKYSGETALIEPMLNCLEPNLVILVSVGRVPEKIASDSHGQTLAYSNSDSIIHTVCLTTNQGTLVLSETDDLYVQATSRGKRKMDDILAQKANKRKTIEAVGDAAAAAAPLVPGGIALCLVKELSWSASDGIKSSADCRTIRSIGQKLYLFIGNKFQLGQPLKLQAINVDKEVIAEKTIKIDNGSSVPTVIVGRVPY